MIAENLIGFENIPQTIPHYCLESFRRHNKKDALSHKINDVWENLSGEAVIERIKYIALGLSDLGVKAGDRIAIISETVRVNRPNLYVQARGSLIVGENNQTPLSDDGRK